MSDLIDRKSLLANCREKLASINDEVGIPRTEIWIIRLFGDMIREQPSVDAIELGVEYNAKFYTIMITTNYTEREEDETHRKWMEKSQTFKVDKK